MTSHHFTPLPRAGKGEPRVKRVWGTRFTQMESEILCLLHGRELTFRMLQSQLARRSAHQVQRALDALRDDLLVTRRLKPKSEHPYESWYTVSPLGARFSAFLQPARSLAYFPSLEDQLRDWFQRVPELVPGMRLACHVCGGAAACRWRGDGGHLVKVTCGVRGLESDVPIQAPKRRRPRNGR